MSAQDDSQVSKVKDDNAMEVDSKQTTKKKNRTVDYMIKMSKRYEVTVNLHKGLHGIKFKKRAPRAIKIIKSTARKLFGVNMVCLCPALNKLVWSRGIRSVPRRMRISVEMEPIRNRNSLHKKLAVSEQTILPYYANVGLCSIKGKRNEVKASIRQSAVLTDKVVVTQN